MGPPADEMGRKIRQIRRRLSLTQKEFADRLGVRQATVSRWESAGDIPEPRALEKIADLGGVLVSTLLDLRQLGGIEVIGIAHGGGRVKRPPKVEYAERPPGALGEFEAVRIETDDLYPYDRGTILYVFKNRNGVPKDCLNPVARSLVETRAGRRRLCRIIEGANNYTLLHFSSGGPMLVDVPLAWGSRVLWARLPDP